MLEERAMEDLLLHSTTLVSLSKFRLQNQQLQPGLPVVNIFASGIGLACKTCVHYTKSLYGCKVIIGKLKQPRTTANGKIKEE